ncbi:MAG TPA: LacI family DNA-binding transcriptional regulator [Halanaerobiales bacterium]|nr:LacI family DNA-binding transcriptional regulator [Halanaerobiales bacterium]
MATINDIAEIAKVSKATVSKVLNNYPGVKEETKEHVLKVMKENNYWPNSIARSLSTSRSYTIGIFDPERLNNFFFRDVFEGVENVFGIKGYDILYFTNKQWEDTWVNFSYTEKSKNRSVDGVMMMGFGAVETSQFDELLESDMPSVFIDINLVGKNTTYVSSDNVEGARKAIKYLYQLGHQKVAMIKGPVGFKPASDRFIGYQKTLNELGIEYNPDWVFSSPYSTEAGYEVMQEIIKLEERPTAIFAEDIFAIGVIQAIRDKGLSVPGDFSVIGFDNIELSEHYELTTISQNRVGLGEAAAKLLLKIIDHQSFSPVILPTELVIRKSCLRI